DRVTCIKAIEIDGDGFAGPLILAEQLQDPHQAMNQCPSFENGGWAQIPARLIGYRNGVEKASDRDPVHRTIEEHDRLVIVTPAGHDVLRMGRHAAVAESF